jgi:type IV pilus assembly protein PilB
MAKLDIAEKRLLPERASDPVQRQRLPERNRLPRVRAATLFGEKIVMRLLDKDKLMLGMTKLGFEQESLTKFEGHPPAVGHSARHGPTEAARRTRCMLVDLQVNTPETNIMTAEPGGVQPGGRQPGARSRRTSA